MPTPIKSAFVLFPRNEKLFLDSKNGTLIIGNAADSLDPEKIRETFPIAENQILVVVPDSQNRESATVCPNCHTIENVTLEFETLPIYAKVEKPRPLFPKPGNFPPKSENAAPTFKRIPIN